MNSSIGKVYRFMVLHEQTTGLEEFRGTPVFRVLDWIIEHKMDTQSLKTIMNAVFKQDPKSNIYAQVYRKDFVEMMKKMMQELKISPKYLKQTLDFLIEYVQYLEKKRTDGNAYDRGSEDAYHRLDVKPHKWPEGTGKGRMVNLSKGSEEWYQYMLGYIHEHDRKKDSDEYPDETYDEYY